MGYNEGVCAAIEILETVTEINNESTKSDRAQAVSEISGAIRELGSALMDLAPEGGDARNFFEAYLQAEFEGRDHGWMGEFLVDMLHDFEKYVDAEGDEWDS